MANRLAYRTATYRPNRRTDLDRFPRHLYPPRRILFRTAGQGWQTLIDNVPLLDVNRGNQLLQDEIHQAIERVITSGRFIYGEDCRELEREVAALCDCDFGVGCASGSDAILLSLMAANVQPGDEVILPSFTFFATGSAVVRLGAKPVFVDIERDSFNIDPDLITAAITPRTKAIMPVHLFGQCARLDEIQAIADKHQICLIEDAAQAIGASYQNRPAANWGEMGCFSFYPTKNLGAYGDAGMVVTNNRQLADQLRLLANHGMQPRYHHQIVGINSRLDSMQAAVLRVKLRQLSQWSEGRKNNADRYYRLFEATDLAAQIHLPPHVSDGRHVWNQFTIRVAGEQRERLRQHLSANGVGSEIYYPIPVHQQPCFTNHAAGISLPETDRAAAEVLSLPIFPELTEAEQEYVVRTVEQFFAQEKAAA